jgi:hypothetical protein
MMSQRPDPILPERIRRISGSFGWIDHRFVRDGFLDALHHPEALLYFFLAAVADSRGISWYGDETIRRLLRIPYLHTLQGAIAELAARDLIVFRNGIYQVLSLPEKRRNGHDGHRDVGGHPSPASFREDESD